MHASALVIGIESRAMAGSMHSLLAHLPGPSHIHSTGTNEHFPDSLCIPFTYSTIASNRTIHFLDRFTSVSTLFQEY